MIGFLNIYKPTGMTSNAVIQKIKKKFHISKIGHMGTLDPLACGILPVAIGKATRLFDYSQAKEKCYTAIFDFGYTTDSLDITGIKTDEIGIVPDEKAILSILSKHKGTYLQIPPKFSAKNIAGKRAYELAREGVEFELKPKEIIVYRIDLVERVSENSYKFDIICSSGTYIRAIGRDIASSLGTFACMSFLERTKTGEFDKSSSVKLDQILNEDNINKYLLSPIQIFKDFGILNIGKSDYDNLLSGKHVPFEDIQKNSFVMYDDCLIGVTKPRESELKLDTFLKQ